MKKGIKKFKVQGLSTNNKKNITLRLEKNTWEEFQTNMKDQRIGASRVINKFMVLTNNLLESNEGGEVAFVFDKLQKENKK